MSIERLFKLGMKTEIPKPLLDCDPNTKNVLHLGAGNYPIEGAIILDFPVWDAHEGIIPIESESIDQIHMYHFLDQIKNATEILRECERVLKLDGHINIVVPYYNSQLRFIGLTPFSAFTERSWDTMFNSKYYQKNSKPWKLKVHFNIIIGVVERNMCLMTQLKKGN